MLPVNIKCFINLTHAVKEEERIASNKLENCTITINNSIVTLDSSRPYITMLNLKSHPVSCHGKEAISQDATLQLEDLTEPLQQL